MKRTLSLKREALAELSTDELRLAVGGTHVACAATDDCTHATLQVACQVPTNPAIRCLSLDRTCPPIIVTG